MCVKLFTRYTHISIILRKYCSVNEIELNLYNINVKQYKKTRFIETFFILLPNPTHSYTAYHDATSCPTGPAPLNNRNSTVHGGGGTINNRNVNTGQLREWSAWQPVLVGRIRAPQGRRLTVVTAASAPYYYAASTSPRVRRITTLYLPCEGRYILIYTHIHT